MSIHATLNSGAVVVQETHGAAGRTGHVVGWIDLNHLDGGFPGVFVLETYETIEDTTLPAKNLIEVFVQKKPNPSNYKEVVGEYKKLLGDP